MPPIEIKLRAQPFRCRCRSDRRARASFDEPVSLRILRRFQLDTHPSAPAPNSDVTSSGAIEGQIKFGRQTDGLKIGASKRRGLWAGGMVPLGYVSRDKKLRRGG